MDGRGEKERSGRHGDLRMMGGGETDDVEEKRGRLGKRLERTVGRERTILHIGASEREDGFCVVRLGVEDTVGVEWLGIGGIDA